MKKTWIFLSLFSLDISAQPAIHWQKCLGGTSADQGRSIQQADDGGYIIAGTAISSNGDVIGNHGGGDFWVVKMSNTGAIQWKKALGGSSSEGAYAIHQTADEGYIVAGYTQSNDGNVSGNHGDRDFWVVKLNQQGAILWQKCLGGSGWEEAWAACQTSDGGYVVAGRTASADGDVTGYKGSFDYWVVKLDDTGNLEWQKALGGSSWDVAYAIKQTSDGGYIVSGESESQDGDVTDPHGGFDFWVVKLDPNGTLQWQKSLGSTSLDRCNSLALATDGGIICTGLISWGDKDVSLHYGGFDQWVVKMDSLGEIIWQKTFGGASEDYAHEIQQTHDGGYVIVGSTSSTDGDVMGNDGGLDMWVVKISESGEKQWQKTLGGTQGDRGFSIFQTNDNGYVIIGDTWSNNGDVSGNHGQSDFWVVKLAPETSPSAMPNTRPLDLFPNPASQSLTLRLPTEETLFQIRITDATGRDFGHSNIQNGENLDIAHLPNGFYLATATTVDGTIFVGRFCKQE